MLDGVVLIPHAIAVNDAVVDPVREGFDCGVTLKDFDGYVVGDVIEAFILHGTAIRRAAVGIVGEHLGTALA